MTFVRLHRVSFAYRDDRVVLEDVSVHFDQGWTALVGPNGAGKTTLLGLVTGALEPDRGFVERAPKTPVFATCPQSVEHLDDGIVAFARRQDGAARRLVQSLELDRAGLARWATLSSGERKRWQIGAALVDAPDVLVLDEPTNHLDREGRAILANVLSRYRGVGIIVSHDRRLLESIATATIRLEAGAAERWATGLVAAKAAWEAERAERERAREAQKVEVRRLAKRLSDKRRARAAAEQGIHASARIKGPKDSDARSALARGRVEMAEKNLGRTVRVARGRFERASAELAEAHVEPPLGRELFVAYEPAPVRRICTYETAGLSRGDTVIADRACLTVERTSRIRLAGRSGSGKSTLLHELLGACHIPAERRWFLPQEIDEASARGLVADLLARGPEERGAVLAIVAALGVPPAAILSTDQPSPGEARKLSIALALSRRVWALFLDEPENHLDLPSIERLETALASYPGALVLVTHDDALADRLTTETWRLPMVSAL